MENFTKIHALMRSDRLAAALGLLLSPETKNINAEYRADLNHAWYCVGDIYFKMGNLHAAKSAFRRSLSFRKDDFEALHAMGNCYSELKRPMLAERYFRSALIAAKAADPSRQADLEFNLANAIFDQGKFDDACEIYRRLAKSNFAVAKSAAKNLELARRSRVKSGVRTQADL